MPKKRRSRFLTVTGALLALGALGIAPARAAAEMAEVVAQASPVRDFHLCQAGPAGNGEIFACRDLRSGDAGLPPVVQGWTDAKGGVPDWCRAADAGVERRRRG